MKLTSGPTTEALTDFDILQQLQNREVVLYNSSNSTIPKATAVELDPDSSRADAMRPAGDDSPTFAGVTAEDVEPGGFGRVFVAGVLKAATALDPSQVLAGEVALVAVNPAVGAKITTANSNGVGILVVRTDEDNIYGRVVKLNPVLIQFRGVLA